MRNYLFYLTLSVLSLAFMIYPGALSLQASSFSLSLDLDGSEGDQAVQSLDVSSNQDVSIQIFGKDIQNVNDISTRFEFNAPQVVYAGFDAGDVLPNPDVMVSEDTNPTTVSGDSTSTILPHNGTSFVEIKIAALSGSATVNSGLIGTLRFRTTDAFSGTEIILVRAELSRGGQVESSVLNVRVVLQVAAPPSPDFDGSGFVDLDDFSMLIRVFGYREGQEQYDARYDLNGDGAIGSEDYAIFLQSYGKWVQRAPVFTSESYVTHFIDENTPVGEPIGGPISATDADGDMLTYSLSGTDVDLFAIDARTGQIQTKEGITYDYEHRTTYSVIVEVRDSQGGTASLLVIIKINDVKEPPSSPPSNFWVRPDNESLTIHFSAVSDEEGRPPVRGYHAEIRRGENGPWGTRKTIYGRTNTSVYYRHIDPEGYHSRILFNGQVYQVRVRAYNSEGESDWSEPVSGTPRPKPPKPEPPEEKVVYQVTPVVAFQDNSARVEISISESTGEGGKVVVPKAALPDDVRDEAEAVFVEIAEISNAPAVPPNTGFAILESSVVFDIRVKTRLESGDEVDIGADLDAPVEICLPVPENISRPVIIHYEGGTWQRLATQRVEGNTICALVDNFSLFSVGELVVYIPSVDDESALYIPDANLRAAIEMALGKASGATITGAEISTLTRLDVQNADISDLTGLEFATHLSSLRLSSNTISDISSLSGLTNLTFLDLESNTISDISPLSGLTNLTRLRLVNNTISDISSLSGLTNLTSLNLRSNTISDISSLSGLTNLTSLNLYSNTITDISPLVTNTGLGSGDEVDVRRNPLNAASIDTHIPALQGRGVEIAFDPRAVSDANLRAAIETALGKASGETITRAEMATLTRLSASDANISDLTGLEFATRLTSLDLRSNTVSDISPLSGLTSLTWLSLYNNTISDISPLSGLTSLTSLDLRRNRITDISPLVTNTGLGSGDKADVRSNPLNVPSIDTHIPALQGRGVEIAFDPEAVSDDPTPVSIPDANLRATLEMALGKVSGATITRADMATLTRLNASDANISDLTGLEFATRLNILNLRSNMITDISSLSGLTSLTWLDLSHNTISAISSLSGLTSLETLYLGSNSITAISSLSGLTSLGTLYLDRNSITAISSLSGLTSLTRLNLSHNMITDISSLSGLTSLTWLNLSYNTISATSSLSGLTSLETLDLDRNSISDISSLSGLTSLETLDLRSNTISDLSPLVSNTGLGSGDEVDVRGNPLNVPSIDTHIPALQGRGVEIAFDPEAVSNDPTPVSIPDANLRAALETALGKASGATITRAEMSTLTRLDAPNEDISDLTGLEYATRLTRLDLGTEIVERRIVNSNSISNLSPLSGLTNLESLDLDSNTISDISSLSGLTSLTRLNLSSNTISDISSLSGLTSLTFLDLGSNTISGISSLSGLTSLTRLNLSSNTISDISSLSGLTSLTWLWLSGNTISDISSLSGLTSLERLWLGGNTISDISSLSGLTNLTWLNLSSNAISDISSLSGLTNLERLWLSGNTISDISSLSGLTSLTWLFLNNNSISDLSPLMANTGLGSGDRVDVRDNPLSDASINTHIPALQGRGVNVSFGASQSAVEAQERGIPVR